MTGYQEILTDPSYAGQIITFTFPHIGNVGTNNEDIETASLAAASGVRGCVLRAPITRASNYRAAQDFDDWLKARGIIAITGVDTRALTALIREKGMPNAVIAHAPDGKFDLEALKRELAAFPGMVGLDLAKDVTSGQSYGWDETEWRWNEGYGRRDPSSLPCRRHRLWREAQHPARARDRRLQAHGRCPRRRPRKRCWRGSLTACSCRTARAIPRRPASMPCRRSGSSSTRACRCSASASAIRCSGSRLAAPRGRCIRAITARTIPVKDFTTGKVEITSMNHGFAVDRDSLPANGRGDACLAVRRLQLRAEGEGQAGVLGAVPSRGVAGPAGQPLSLQALRRADGREEGQRLIAPRCRNAQT